MVSPQSSLLHQHGEKRKMMGVDQRLRKRIRINERRNIHDLPDDLLRNILGRLDFRDAAATSLLSRRLLEVWTFSTCLDFEDDTDCQYQSGNDFMKFVNFVMNKHHGSRVDFLRIAFNAVGLEEDDDVQVNAEKWVEFARSKCVRSLEFDMNRAVCGSPSSIHSPYGFPLDVFYPSLSSLNSLSVKSISISDDDIAYLLERCVVNLETLVVENAPHLKNVKISAQKLKHLKIRYCHNLLNIDLVSVPNLQSFEKAADYTDVVDVVRVSFCGNVAPKLSSVYLRGVLCQNVLSELQKYAPSMELLELDTEAVIAEKSHSECCSGYPRNFPWLENLKQLVLKTDLVEDGVNCFMYNMFSIAACPLLQNLTLKYRAIRLDGKFPNLWDSSKRRSFTHRSLKTVEFIGWWGLMHEVEFANYLVGIATNLEKVTFDPNDPHRMDPFLWCPPHSPVEKEEKDLKAAVLSAQQLIDNNSGLVAYEIVSPAY